MSGKHCHVPPSSGSQLSAGSSVVVVPEPREEGISFLYFFSFHFYFTLRSELEETLHLCPGGLAFYPSSEMQDSLERYNIKVKTSCT